MPLVLICALAWSADPPPDEPELMAELRSMMGEDPAPRLPSGSYRMFTIAPLIVRDDGKLVGVASDRLRVGLLEHARELGWPAVGADDLLFDRDRGDEAQLVVGGEVQRVYEADVLGDSGWVVEVRWEVLDRARDAVVYSGSPGSSGRATGTKATTSTSRSPRGRWSACSAGPRS